MSYIEQSLSNNEKIIKLFNLHWMHYHLPIIVFVILAIFTLGITLIFAIWYWLSVKNLEMGITNKRAVIKKGILSRNSQEIKLDAVETVEINQGVIGRMLNYGNVRLTGRGISDLVYANIVNPIEAKKQIESITP